MEIKIDDNSKVELSQLLAAYQKAIDFSIICSITDVHGAIIYVNDRFCEVSKFSRKELLGQNHRIVNSTYHPNSFFRNMWETITKGEIWRGEVKSKAKDGTCFWLDSTIIPLFGEDGKISHYFSLRVSIDDRKLLEKQCEMRVKSLEGMLFKVSHKFRQPLTQIMGLVDILQSSTISRKELTMILGYLKDSAEMLDLFTKELNQFITIAKIEAVNHDIT